MGEPIRRDTREALRSESAHRRRETYATDVLLIAESPQDRQSRDAHGNPSSQATEPLDVENVVRRLIALLNEQESKL
jgi:hypothetical protein